MCNCKGAHPDQLNVDYKYPFSLDDCLCNTKHKLFAVKCTNCRHNIIGFTRN